MTTLFHCPPASPSSHPFLSSFRHLSRAQKCCDNTMVSTPSRGPMLKYICSFHVQDLEQLEVELVPTRNSKKFKTHKNSESLSHRDRGDIWGRIKSHSWDSIYDDICFDAIQKIYCLSDCVSVLPPGVYIVVLQALFSRRFCIILASSLEISAHEPKWDSGNCAQLCTTSSISYDMLRPAKK